MTIALSSAVIRIRAANDHVVGAGFLVGQRHMLTCAHVVAQAVGLPEDTPEALQGEVLLDFPLVAPGHILSARIVHWQHQSDVAVLDLNGEPLADVETVHLVKADDLWGHAFRAFGFPSGHDDGVWASGVLRGQTAAGWVQIEDVKGPGYRVQPGFSGTPVWDEQLSGVVGMAIAADTDRVTKAAFVIPVDQLVAVWPDLGEQSIKAGSLEHLQAQLAMFEAAQCNAADPRRFQTRIDELRADIADWDRRVESQRQRIVDGLEEQRQQLAEESARRRHRERLQIVGRPPLDVADYFKDRQRELATIGRLLAEPTTRLVSIIGHGGIGKTALACKVLQDLECHRWPHTSEDVPIDGIVYLSTRTTGISLERLFFDALKLLGGEQEIRLSSIWTNSQIGIEDKVSYLLEALGDGQYVILLDNIEDLLDDRGHLLDEDLRLFFDRSLTTAHGARLLVTSRISLAFRREVMRFDRQVKLLEGLPAEDGIALLRELDPNNDCGLRHASEAWLAETVKLAHGVPRALEVIAGILANDPFAALDDVLQHFYEQKDVVQALIEENYKRLDRNARRVIEALAVFRRPVPPLAVDYLLEPFTPGLDVPGIIQRLVRTNVVSVDRATKTVVLHPIDQDFAYSQLPEEKTGESAYTRQALELRAADYYVRLRTLPEIWRTIDDLEPQLNEFEHRIRAEDYDNAYRLLKRIDADYLFLWGHYTHLVRMREKLMPHLTTPYSQIENLGRLGLAYHSLGSFEEAIACHEAAVAITREMDNRKEEGRHLGYLGKNYHFTSQLRKATALYEEAVAIARETGDREYEGMWLGYLGYVHRILGRLEQSVDELNKALVIARDPGTRNRAEEGRHLGNLGSSYRNLGQPDQAAIYYEQALVIAQELGYLRYEGIWRGCLGSACRDRGEFEQAIEHAREALCIARAVGDRRHESMWLGSLGLAYRALGRSDQAIKFYKESLAVIRATGERLEESAQLSRLGDVYRSQGLFKQAIEHSEKALAIAQEIDDRLGKSYHLLGIGQALLSTGEAHRAYRRFLEAYKLDMPRTSHLAALMLGITCLYQLDSGAEGFFATSVDRCRMILNKLPSMHGPRYILAAALVGRAVCDPRWAAENKRSELIAPALGEYRRALELTSAPGVVQDALHDLELIRAADVDGLEPAFDLLESALPASLRSSLSP